MAKKKASHPNKIGKVGPKKKQGLVSKIQISGPYIMPDKCEELGGKDVLRVKVQDFVDNLNQ